MSRGPARSSDAENRPSSSLRQARRDWQTGVTEVLRGLRRDLKHHDAPSETVFALRERIKQAELLAERENLQRWQTWALDNEQPTARLRNVPVSSQDTGRWLQENVLLPQDAKMEGCVSKTRQALQHAFSVLGQQLDPLRRAR